MSISIAQNMYFILHVCVYTHIFYIYVKGLLNWYVIEVIYYVYHSAVIERVIATLIAALISLFSPFLSSFSTFIFTVSFLNHLSFIYGNFVSAIRQTSFETVWKESNVRGFESSISSFTRYTRVCFTYFSHTRKKKYFSSENYFVKNRSSSFSYCPFSLKVSA